MSKRQKFLKLSYTFTDSPTVHFFLSYMLGTNISVYLYGHYTVRSEKEYVFLENRQ